MSNFPQDDKNLQLPHSSSQQSLRSQQNPPKIAYPPPNTQPNSDKTKQLQQPLNGVPNHPPKTNLLQQQPSSQASGGSQKQEPTKDNHHHHVLSNQSCSQPQPKQPKNGVSLDCVTKDHIERNEPPQIQQLRQTTSLHGFHEPKQQTLTVVQAADASSKPLKEEYPIKDNYAGVHDHEPVLAYPDPSYIYLPESYLNPPPPPPHPPPPSPPPPPPPPPLKRNCCCSIL